MRPSWPTPGARHAADRGCVPSLVNTILLSPMVLLSSSICQFDDSLTTKFL